MGSIAIIGSGAAAIATAYHTIKGNNKTSITIIESEAKGGEYSPSLFENTAITRTLPVEYQNSQHWEDILKEMDLEQYIQKHKDLKGYTVKDGYYQKLPGEFLNPDNYFPGFGSGGFLLFGGGKKITRWEGITLFDLLKNSYGENFSESTGSSYSRYLFASESDDIAFEALYPGLYECLGTNSTIKAAAEQYKNNKRSHNGADQSFSPYMFSFKTDKEHENWTDKAVEWLKQHQTHFEFFKPASITKQGKKYLIHSKKQHYGPFDAVVFTGPAQETSHLVKETDKELAAILGSIEYTKLNLYYLSWNKKDLATSEPYFVIPRKEKYTILGAHLLNNLRGDLQNNETALIQIAIPGDLSLFDDNEVQEMVLRDLHKIFKLKSPPRTGLLIRDLNYFPKKNKSYLTNINTIKEKASSHPGIFFAGKEFGANFFGDLADQGKEIANALREIVQE